MSKRLLKDFRSLSWFDLESWAGSRIVSRERSYQRNKAVRDLAITESGELVAWVRGSTTYAIKVSFDKGALASVCSCPYCAACKHAVAVILEYLDCIENRKSVPQAGKDDERLMLLESESEYPDKAIAILKRLAERHISMTNVSAYGTGAQYLRKAQRILKQKGRETEWNDYLQGLKEVNRRKPRCIEILDALSEKPIIRGNR